MVLSIRLEGRVQLLKVLHHLRMAFVCLGLSGRAEDEHG